MVLITYRCTHINFQLIQSIVKHPNQTKHTGKCELWLPTPPHKTTSHAPSLKKQQLQTLSMMTHSTDKWPSKHVIASVYSNGNNSFLQTVYLSQELPFSVHEMTFFAFGSQSFIAKQRNL